jgi:cell wall-associated NlpC family hydrolase
MCCRVGASSLVVGIVITSVVSHGTGIAVADPGSPPGIAGLVADVANANQRLQELGASIQTEQESVNAAILGVQTARDNAAAAQRDVEASRVGLEDANDDIAAAQKRFDAFAASTYMNGPSAAYVTADDPSDIIGTATAGQTLAISSQQVMADLQRARTEQVNHESSARLAKQKADKAVADAQASQDSAVDALTQAQRTFGDQQVQLDRLIAERAAAQAKLEAARPTPPPAATVRQQSAAAPAAGPAPAANPTPGTDWDRAPGGQPQAGQASEWDVTLPAIPSAFVSGDPIAIINAILGIAQTSMQVTQDLGRNFLQKLGILPTPTGVTNGAIPRVYGRQASEYVIQRMQAQQGVPYSWGGGNAAGASRGIDSGAGTVGFDCSGLMLYGFAGVGIKLDHYTGSQYNAGRKIPTSQMRRGDMIFYGPNASQHVAMYLGDGQMLEAPYTGSVVKVSPVRTSGMTPYVTRMIEY